MSKKSKEDHPFFCHKKNCRKTANDTPDYMSNEDWEFLVKVVKLLKEGTANDLYFLLWANGNSVLTRNFFYHAIGWPEGHCYCMQAKYFDFAFPNMIKHDLPKLEEALKNKGLT